MIDNVSQIVNFKLFSLPLENYLKCEGAIYVWTLVNILWLSEQVSKNVIAVYKYILVGLESSP